ncbi:MAG: ParB N-terminal domain-containing protein [Bacillota bacterium]|nr:ParB N-terminal domain-containing protein [Bacillota bacterium]
MSEILEAKLDMEGALAERLPGREEEVPLALLEPSPPEVNFFREGTEEEVAELARSMASQGLIHAVVVRLLPGGRYQVLAGHRRVRAAELLGWKVIRARVVDVPDEEAELIVIDSNLLVRQLNPLEKVEAIRRKHRLLCLIRERERKLAVLAAGGRRNNAHENSGVPGIQGRPQFSGRGIVLPGSGLGSAGSRGGLAVITAGQEDVVSRIAREMGIGRFRVEQSIAIAEHLIPAFREPFARGELPFSVAYELCLMLEEDQEAVAERYAGRLGSLTVKEARGLREECERRRRGEKSAAELREQEVREELERLRKEYAEAKEQLDRAVQAREIAEARARALEEEARRPAEEVEKRARQEASREAERRYGEKLAGAQGKVERLEAQVRRLEMENANLQSVIRSMELVQAAQQAREVERLEARKRELEAQVAAVEWVLKESAGADSEPPEARGLRFWRVLERSASPLLREIPGLEDIARGALLPEPYLRAVSEMGDKLSRVARLVMGLVSRSSSPDGEG